VIVIKCKQTLASDLSLLETWETNRPMHLDIMLRIPQIRRENPQSVIGIGAETTSRKKKAKPSDAS
jgi:hypothetical protein